MKPRDYKHEYEMFHSSEKSKLDRAARNKMRRKMEKMGRAHKGDGMDVDHKNGNPRDNRMGNVHMMDAGKNRAKH